MKEALKVWRRAALAMGGGDEARPHGQGKRLLGHDQGPFYLLFFSYILWHGECVKKKKKRFRKITIHKELAVNTCRNYPFYFLPSK